MNIKSLYENKWVSLFETDGYVYSEETRCNGKIVVVLPFKKERIGLGRFGLRFLLHMEVTPAWKTKSLPERIFSNSITGGVEGDNPVDDAVRELYEEAGYKVSAEQMIKLGTSYGIKSCNTIYHYFACDVTNITPSLAKGDGSKTEAKEWCEWFDDLHRVDDPLVAMAWLRLMKKLS